MQGVQDIAAAWGTFVGKNNGMPHGSLRGGLSGAWHAWCVREAAMERTRRDERASGVRKTANMRLIQEDNPDELTWHDLENRKEGGQHGGK